ncbi:hypothetical protein AAFX91_32780, partial [Bradyrhizobium sp. 31Argb]
TDPIRYRRPNPDGQFSGNILGEAMRVLRGAPVSVLTAAKPRLGKMAASVAAFALGCAAGACLYAKLGTWCFVLPPLIALPAVFLAPAEPK